MSPTLLSCMVTQQDIRHKFGQDQCSLLPISTGSLLSTGFLGSKPNLAQLTFSDSRCEITGTTAGTTAGAAETFKSGP